MTKNSPRIYVYKITFDEVDHYYYGIHKEKFFDEYYMGSPVTHKEYWEKYTPRKEYIEFFEYSDEGYAEARIFEDNLIAPALNDEFCLNEHVGGFLSLESCRKGGKIAYEQSVGIHARSKEQMSEHGKSNYKIGLGLITTEERIKIGKKLYKSCSGIHNLSKEKIIKNAEKGGQKAYELELGFHSLPKEEKIKNARKAGKVSNSQKWQCTVTGYVSSSGPLTLYQKKRGINPSNRIKVNGPRGWEITFEDGRVIVTYQTLKEWAEENGYTYRNIRNVREGIVKKHKGIIKVVPF